MLGTAQHWQVNGGGNSRNLGNPTTRVRAGTWRQQTAEGVKRRAIVVPLFVSRLN